MIPRPHPTPPLFRDATRFWIASLAGFALHGWVLAASAARGLAEGEAAEVRSDAIRTALELGLAEALLLGVPAALLFAAALARVRSRRGPVALGAGLAMAVALSSALAAWGWAAVDAGLAHGPTLHVALGAVTAAAGAAAAVVARPAPLPGEAREGPRGQVRVAR